MAVDGEDDVPELTTFQSREAYVYAPLPPAPHYGHRAELWDVNKWLQEVKVRVVSRQDSSYVRMEDLETGIRARLPARSIATAAAGSTRQPTSRPPLRRRALCRVPAAQRRRAAHDGG
ncbi:MAG: hypothetical protein J3K34DRAFT_84342 [Monoraphidium minutum]|nr:MAG: hypothetical protein J3K34DRAFT_84342 [Monoraphidium minutum]